MFVLVVVRFSRNMVVCMLVVWCWLMFVGLNRLFRFSCRLVICLWVVVILVVWWSVVGVLMLMSSWICVGRLVVFMVCMVVSMFVVFFVLGRLMRFRVGVEIV